jgi:DHA2 family multidrug resistance protein
MKNSGSQWIVLWNIILIGLLGVFSGSAGFIGESTLQGDLALSSDDMRWVSISYIMVLGMVLPLAVFLAQRYGYKRIFFYGSAVFLMGSLFSGFAFDFTSTLLSRALSGIGAGALFPLSIAVIDQVFTKKQITFALVLYVGLVFGGGSGLGFLLGGYLVQYVSWQSPFLVCSAVGCVSLFITHFFHPETEPHRDLKFDTWGYVTFVIFISSILLILNCAKAEWNTNGWDSLFMWSCYVLGFISLILFIILELLNPAPLISFALFKTNSFFTGCIAIFFIGAPLYATQLLSTTFLDALLGYEKHTIGLLLTTLGITLGATSMCTVFLSRKISIRVLTLTGMAIITVSCFLAPAASIYSNHTQLLWIWNLRMIGVGLALGPATSLSLSELPPSVAGAAAVFITLFRQVGGTIGSLWAEVVSDTRSVFHQQMFGSQISTLSPAFQSTLQHLKSYLIRQAGALPAEAEAQARALIQSDVLVQARAASIGDAFFLLGIATLLSCALLLLEMGWSAMKRRRRVKAV